MQKNRYNITLGDQIIAIEDRYHYLGMTFTSSGSFVSAREHVTQQSNKALHLQYSRCNNADLPFYLTLKLFDHPVLPILIYGSEIFGFENLELLDKAHYTFLRRFTRARKSTPKYMLLGELGRYPVEITVKIKMISFWVRLLLGKQSKLSYFLYQYMLYNTDQNFRWVIKTKDVLNSVSRTDLWINQNTTVDKSTQL